MTRTELLTLAGYTEDELITIEPEDAVRLVKDSGATLMFIHQQTEEV